MEPDNQSNIVVASQQTGPDTECSDVIEKPGPPVGHHPVFVVDDSFFRARTPKSTHWSIAWSDLMMTMFVLFLTLFVYQLTHREFLTEESPEILAGTSMPVPTQEKALPFAPISPILSKQKNMELKRLEPVETDEVDALFEDIPEQEFTESALPEEPIEQPPLQPEKQLPGVGETRPALTETPPIVAPTPSPEPTDQELITKIYDLSKVTLASEKLEKFAQVELIPDKTMRIILTGDLLFASGQARLTKAAKQSLRKLLPVIKKTPYMINVIGHTDSIPMHSERFANNWQLSTARASQVAEFLIKEGNIPPTQFVTSGYSYYRPLKPNTTAANRKANRRVEIILSKELPPALPATRENIQ